METINNTENQLKSLGINLHEKNLVEHVNFSLIVIIVLGQVGMQPIESSISDLGDFQNTESNGQTDLTQIQQLLSAIEGAITNQAKGLPAGWYNQNEGKVNAASKALQNFFIRDKNNQPLDEQYLYFPIPGGGYYKLSVTDPRVMKILDAGYCYVTGTKSANIDITKPASDLMQIAVCQLQTMIDTFPSYMVQSNGSGSWELKANALSGSSGSLIPDPEAFYENNAMFSGAKEVYSDFQETVTVPTNSGSTEKMTIYKAITVGNSDQREAALNQIANNYWASQNQNSGSGDSAPTNPMSDEKWLSNAGSDLGTSQSYFQTQTQENTSQIQQDSSQLTSYDQVGQSIVSDAAKASQNMVQNQKSA